MKDFRQEFNKQYLNLNTAQRQAVDAIYGTVMVLAGPGTGKTQVLAMRIANLLLQPDISPYNILCLTFSNAGVSAMKRRLFQLVGTESNRITVSTFHAFCNQIILENPLFFGTDKPLKQIQELEQIEIMDNVLFQLPYEHPFKNKREEYRSVRQRLLGFLKIMEDEGILPQKMLQWFENYRNAVPELFAKVKKPEEITQKGVAELEKIDKWRTAVEIAERYQQAVQEAGLYDYNAMINQVVRAFQQEETLLARYQERFQFVLVDEYQDTNGAQNQVLELLMGYWQNPNLFVVGDDDQAIYRFQGANTANLIQIIERFPPQTFVVLDQNYRSTQPILDAAMLVINNLKNRLVNYPDIQQRYQLEKKLYSQLSQFGEKPACFALDSAELEIFLVCDLIHQKLRQNIAPKEIAVLVRKNKHAEKLFKILEKQQIPVSLSKTSNLLAEKFADNVLYFLEYLVKSYTRSFLPNEQNERLFHLLLFPWWGVGSFSAQQAYTKWEQHTKNNRLEDFHSFLHLESTKQQPEYSIDEKIMLVINDLSTWVKMFQELSFEEWLECVLLQSGIVRYSLQEPAQLIYVEQLKSLFSLLQDRYLANPEIKIVFEKIRKMQQEGLVVPVTTFLGTSRGIRISTLHSAKGEEYSHVIMINNSQKYWDSRNNSKPFVPPVSYLDGVTPKNQLDKSKDDAMEDERRLFYVGVTRAKSSLTLTYSMKDPKDERLLFLSEMIAGGCCREQTLEPQVAQQLIQQYFSDSLSTPELDTFETLPAQYFTQRLEDFQLSVTHLNAFFECPRKFYLEHIIKLPAAFSPDSAFGTAVHETLRWLMENYKKHSYIPDIEYFIQNFAENIAKYHHSFTEPKFNTYSEKGEAFLRNYYQQAAEIWKNLKSWWTEQTLDAQLNVEENAINLTGKLDLILQDTENKWVCVDYKTGKSEKSVFEKRTQKPTTELDYQQLSIKQLAEMDSAAGAATFGGKYWRQMAFYQLLTSQHPAFHTSNHFQFHLLEAIEQGAIFQTVPISRFDNELIINQIQFFYRSLQAFSFPKKDSSLQEKEPCTYCNFKKICW